MASQITADALIYKTKQMYLSGSTPSDIAIACNFIDEETEDPNYEAFCEGLLKALTAGYTVLPPAKAETKGSGLSQKLLSEFFVTGGRRGMKPCHIYLVDSGNHDQVYKIGITTNKPQRIKNIRKTYGVPNAQIMKTTMVGSSSSAKSIEAELHRQFDECRVNTYYGVEWFALQPNQVNEIIEFLSQEY